MTWVDYVRLPATGLATVLVLVAILRWAFGGGSSLVERRARPGRPGDYGVLVAVAEPTTRAEGEAARRRLADSGVRATLVDTADGPRVMVFAEDASRARTLLSGGPR